MKNQLNDIIKACVQKDFASQKRLYNLFVDRLYYTVKRYIKDDYFIQNILQDVFLKAFNKIDTFDKNKASFSTWINTIAIHESINYLRKRKLTFTDLEEHRETSPLENNKYLLKLDAEIMLKEISKLPMKYQVVFNLYEIDGYKHNEIAEILDIKASTSRSSLTRAKQLLQKALILTTINEL